MIELKYFCRLRTMADNYDGYGGRAQFHISINLRILSNGSMGFFPDLLRPSAAPTMPGGDLWAPNKSAQAARTTVQHVKETLGEVTCLYVLCFSPSFSLSLHLPSFLSLTRPPSPSPSSSHFTGGTEGRKRLSSHRKERKKNSESRRGSL